METYTSDFSMYARMTGDSVAALFNTDIKQGLALKQVQEHRRLYGANKLTVRRVRLWQMIKSQSSSSIIVIFFGLGVLALVLGERTNALMIFLCVSINLIFGWYQVYSSSKAIALLRKYLVSPVKVRRDGNDHIIPSTELVVGDIVVLNAGDRLFADVRIMQDRNLAIDESVLTGESAAQTKTAAVCQKKETSIYDAFNIGFGGTTVVGGSALGIVFAVGGHSMFGHIAEPDLEEVRESAIALRTRELGTFLVQLIIVTLVFVFCMHFLIQGKKDYLEMFMFVIALTVSVVPEALPIVVTFCLASGATKLAKKTVLVKRLSAIEDLGTVEVLCVDKTGTLTENKVILSNTYTSKGFDTVLRYAALGSEFLDAHKLKEVTGKGFDGAIYRALTPELVSAVRSFERVAEAPYDPERKVNSVLVREAQSPAILIVRGMQEDVIPLCDEIDRECVNAWVEAENRQGHRIVAVAFKVMGNDVEGDDLIKYEHGLRFVGMVSLSDPLKPTVFEAIKKSKQLGLHVKMLSGDNKAVCSSIGQQIGLITDQADVLTGAEFMALDDSGQEKAALGHAVFARCLPAHKLKIIQVLQRTRVVAYLGDGINDIPALKMADVSLVVRDAVDIARDAADIIVPEKSMLPILDAIEEGRRIVINVVKYIKITISNHFGNLYAVVFVYLLIDYMPILPVHLLVINLVSDFPLLAISTDVVDPRGLQVPQRFSLIHIALFVFLVGSVGNVADLMIFWLFRHGPPETMQMAWYLENIFTALVLIFSARTASLFFKAERPSNTLVALSVLALVAAVIPFYTKWGHILSALPPLSLQHMSWVMGVVGVYVVMVECMKHLYYLIIARLPE